MSLERFVEAQAGSYAKALAELRAGRKRTHWIWYVLPQLAGLGRSEIARYYALADLDEARAYLAHPVLGTRLHECAEALLALPGDDPVAVLGEVDALKARSSTTLFAQLDPAFGAVLDRYYGGQPDPVTLSLLS